MFKILAVDGLGGFDVDADCSFKRGCGHGKSNLMEKTESRLGWAALLFWPLAVPFCLFGLVNIGVDMVGVLDAFTLYGKALIGLALFGAVFWFVFCLFVAFFCGSGK